MGKKQYNNYNNFKTDKPKEDSFIKDTDEKETIKIQKGKVNCNLLNVRTKPDINSKSLMVIENNDEVIINEILNDWCKVNVKGIDGYCMTEFIDFI